MKRVAIATATASALALISVAAKAAPVPTTPAAQSFRLGALTLVSLRDETNVVPNNGSVFGKDQTPAAVAAVLKQADAPTDKVTLGVDALMVREPGHVVLIDTGLGPKVGGVLQGSLKLAGVAPTAITDVLITHSHGDHVGGLVTADGKPAFPKATVRMSATEWAWMRQQKGSAAIVAVIAPQVKTFEPGRAVLPGITPVAIPGHTPGHVGYEIESNGQRLIDIGDTAHSTIVSLAKPGWMIGYDTDSAQGRASREALLHRLANSHEWVFAPHFPYPGTGRITAAGNGFGWQPGRP